VSAEETSSADLLRLTREQRGESVDHVHQLTGISERIIRGLESGAEIVEPVYMRLAALTYAQHLGLDVDRVAELYDAHSGVYRAEPLQTPGRAAFIESPTAQGAFPKLFSGSADLVARLKTMPPTQIAILVAIGAVIVIYFALSDSSPEPETIPPPATSDAISTKAEAGRLSVADPGAASSGPETAAGGGSRGDGSPSGDVAAHEIAKTEDASPNPAPEEPTTRIDTDATEPPDPAEPATADATEPPDPAEPATADATEPPISGQPDPPPLVLQAHAVDTTWVRVRMDGLDSTIVTILPGEDESWEARDFFVVRAGKPHGVHFTFQGDLLGDGRLGEPTGVLLFRASRQGVALLESDELPGSPKRDSTATVGAPP
jgi:cytoskeletal protein RodZ